MNLLCSHHAGATARLSFRATVSAWNSNAFREMTGAVNKSPNISREACLMSIVSLNKLGLSISRQSLTLAIVQNQMGHACHDRDNSPNCSSGADITHLYIISRPGVGISYQHNGNPKSRYPAPIITRSAIFCTASYVLSFQFLSGLFPLWPLVDRRPTNSPRVKTI